MQKEEYIRPPQTRIVKEYMLIRSPPLRGIYPSGMRGALLVMKMQATKKNVDFMTLKRAAWQMLTDVPDVPQNTTLHTATLQGFRTDAELQFFTPFPPISGLMHLILYGNSSSVVLLWIGRIRNEAPSSLSRWHRAKTIMSVGDWLPADPTTW